MKKRVFLTMMIAVCAVGAFLASCDKDDDTTCTCDRFDADTNCKTGTSQFDPQDYGVSRCRDLADVMDRMSAGDYYYTCH